MSILLCLSAPKAALGGGPFENFFKALRRTFNQPQQTHHTSKSSGNSNRSTASNSSSKPGPTPDVHEPPNHENVRSARATSGTKDAKGDFQYGVPVPGKEGFVTSPYAPNSGYVDVRGFPPGTQVKDPYTGKTFLTP
jgi:hypothetical protein